jgi:hypothetical protein
MDLTKRLEQYADDFDTTVEDDDWSRIRRHFTDDAVREEQARASAHKSAARGNRNDHR